MEDIIKLPLWKSCLEQMRKDGLTYGSMWQAEYFEEHLRCARDEQRFAFEMMNLKQEIEEGDGYYLQSEERGSRWSIPSAAAHEYIAGRFDNKTRRYAVRSIDIRSATLLNPAADLTKEEREQMERNLEKASLRLVLMSRAASIAKVVNEYQPRLLQKENTGSQ